MVMTWPLVAQLGTHIPAGLGMDVWTHQWTFWWVRESITQGRNPFHTDLIFHPHGVSLAYHNIAWLNIAIWLPLQAVLGSSTAYSLTYIIIFALNCFAMYLLAREWTGSPLAAFVGGLVYGLWPFTVSQSGHPNMIVTCWIPLTLLYLRRTLEKGSARDAVITAIFLALTGIARWQLLILGSIVVGLYLLYKCLTDRACRTWRTLGLLALVGGIAAILMAPLAAPPVAAQLTRSYPEDAFVDEQASRQTDALAYVLPNRNQYVWEYVISKAGLDLESENDQVAFLGYTTIVLAFLGTIKQWRSARFWVLASVLYIALALGPLLRVGGQLYPQIPMPYRLVGNLFLIRILSEPQRFNIFLGLPLGMLASLGVATLLPKHRPSWWKSALLLGIVGILILGEYCIVPYNTIPYVTPAWYAQLAQEPGRFAILDLPMGTRFYDKQYTFYQITHGKPLVGGHVSRTPREAFAFLNSTPFLEQLQRKNEMDPSLKDITHQLQPLSEADIRYIVLHKKLATMEQLASWQDWLAFKPHYEDEDLVVYRTKPRMGQDLIPAYQMTGEISLIRIHRRPHDRARPDLIQVDTRWGSTAPPARDYDVCLQLVDPHGAIAQSECQPLCSAWPTSRWENEEIARGNYALQIDSALESQVYTLTLTLADAATTMEAGYPITLGAMEVQVSDSQASSVPRPAHPLHTRWGEVILLNGYDLRCYPDSLDVTLYWQAEQKMDVSYKVFVHLTDATSGALAAQDDSVPRRWTYPTTSWEPGEVIEDTVSLPLDAEAGRQYRLLVGLYDMYTGERLPPYSSDGDRYADDIVPLITFDEGFSQTSGCRSGLSGNP
jgi:hypothetical protein